MSQVLREYQLNCVPLPLQASGKPLYEVWYSGRQLVAKTPQPTLDGAEALKKMGLRGTAHVWSPDKPYLTKVVTIQ